MCLIVGTFFSYRTYSALRSSSGTDIPPEKHEWMVERLFFFYRKYTIDLSICLLWSLRRDYTYTVHHSVYMGIDSYVWHIIEYREHDFRSLDTDTRECLYEPQIIWKDSPIFL